MSLTAALVAAITGPYSRPRGLGVAHYTLATSLQKNLFPGVDANQVDLAFQDARVLTTGATENLDLAGSLTDAIGDVTTFQRVKVALIYNRATSAASLTVGGGTNPFLGWFSAGTYTFSVPPDGLALHTFPGTGWPVTNLTADILKMTNAGGGSLTYDIILLGASVGPVVGQLISVGENWQTRTDAAPAATTFLGQAGTHLNQSWIPKDGNIYLLQPGCILDGTNTTQYSMKRKNTSPATGPDNVKLTGGRITRYLGSSQTGAVVAGWALPTDSTTGWTLEDTEIDHCGVYAVRLGHNMALRRLNMHHNGALGLGGIGDYLIMEDCTVAFSNLVSALLGFESGGFKFVKSVNQIVRRNWIHHNIGCGAWWDIGNIGMLGEDNLIEWNHQEGMVNEIGYGGGFHRNTCRYNGLTDWRRLNFPWASGLALHASGGAGFELWENISYGNAHNITMIQQARGTAHGDGTWVDAEMYVQNVNAHDNVDTVVTYDHKWNMESVSASPWDFTSVVDPGTKISRSATAALDGSFGLLVATTDTSDHYVEKSGLSYADMFAHDFKMRFDASYTTTNVGMCLHEIRLAGDWIFRLLADGGVDSTHISLQARRNKPTNALILDPLGATSYSILRNTIYNVRVTIQGIGTTKGIMQVWVGPVGSDLLLRFHEDGIDLTVGYTITSWRLGATAHYNVGTRTGAIHYDTGYAGPIGQGTLGTFEVNQDVGDNAIFTTRGNVIDKDVYALAGMTNPFSWMNAARTFAVWQGTYLNDVNGSANP